METEEALIVLQKIVSLAWDYRNDPEMCRAALADTQEALTVASNAVYLDWKAEKAASSSKGGEGRA